MGVVKLISGIPEVPRRNQRDRLHDGVVMATSEEIQTYGGTDVEVEIVKPLSGGGCRLDVTAPSGRRWRVDVTASGSPDLVTAWNHAGEVDVTLSLPEWIDDVIAQLSVSS
jgi:hypothetical protein